MKKVSEINEKEVVSILNGDIIFTKVNSLFILVSKTGIQSSNVMFKELDLESQPCEKAKLFSMMEKVSNLEMDFNTLQVRDLINTTFVADEFCNV